MRDTARNFANGHTIALFEPDLSAAPGAALAGCDHALDTARLRHQAQAAASGRPRPRPKPPPQQGAPWTCIWNGLRGSAILIGLAVWLLRPAALPAAAPVLALWMASRGISAWLNRAPRTMNRALPSGGREHGSATMRRGSAASSATGVRTAPTGSFRTACAKTAQVELRLSPTNLGMLLNARIAAVHFGVIDSGRVRFRDQADARSRRWRCPNIAATF